MLMRNPWASLLRTLNSKYYLNVIYFNVAYFNSRFNGAPTCLLPTFVRAWPSVLGSLAGGGGGGSDGGLDSGG